MGKENFNNTCCIFNFAPHYRAPIYSLMDKELFCDFYFGDRVETTIKPMDVEKLNGYKNTVKNKKIVFNKFWWQKGVIGLVFKKQYKNFILTGDASILSNWIILFLCLILQKKVFIWMHGLNKKPNWKGRILTYPFYYMASKYLLYGEFAKSIMIKLGFSQKKMACIYNSLDYDLQLSLRSNLVKTSIYNDYFKNNYPTIIYIGRIQKLKKIDMIFDSIEFLENKNINCNLIIIGPNVDNINIEDLIKKKKIYSKVWIYGPCYNEKIISEFIYNAHVCVSPGNIGLTALHSLVYGTPVITHNNFEKQMPEFEAIQSNLTGDFFIEDDIIDLTDKISKWINLDPSEREKVRLESFKTIDEKYNPNFQIKLLKELLI